MPYRITKPKKKKFYQISKIFRSYPVLVSIRFDRQPILLDQPLHNKRDLATAVSTSTKYYYNLYIKAEHSRRDSKNFKKVFDLKKLL